MSTKKNSKRTSVWVRVSARRPGPSPVVVLDGKIMNRAYYRDNGGPAGSVWYSLNDPDAIGTLVVLAK